MQLSELMCRIRLGDRDALKALIAEYGGGVYQQALAKTNDKALAKEITQKTFAQLVTSLQSSADSDGWRLWLDTLAEKTLAANLTIRSDMDFTPLLFDASDAPPAPLRQPHAPESPVVRRDRPHSAPRKPDEFESYINPPRRTADTRRPSAQRHGKNQRAKTGQRSGAGRGIGIFLLVALCLLLLWLCTGIAMNLGYLPRVDLGYDWFNTAVYPLF